MNYIIEDNIDFFSEILNDDHDDSDTTMDICLLSGLPLSENHIELHCNHKFNYLHLFNEVKIQKTVYNRNSSTRLKHNEIMCPYCRQITTKLLPYVPNIDGVDKILGVNRPQSLCMNFKNCCYTLKRGKNKGSKCGHCAFETEFGTLCENHWKKCVENAAYNKDTTFTWTDEMEYIMNNNTVSSLKQKLREKKLRLKGKKRDLVIRLVLNQ